MKKRSNQSPVKFAKTQVPNRVQYEPNYDAKCQDGMTAAKMKVGKKVMV